MDGGVKKLILSIFLVLGILAGFEYLAHSYFYVLNRGEVNNIHECIYRDDHKAQKGFQTWDGTPFTVTYVKESKDIPTCVNPKFPAIHIEGTANTAWIQFIFTDAGSNGAWNFVDTVADQKIFPFYTHSKDFYDAPLWQKGFFFKPLSYWKAHAYAVAVIDREKDLPIKICPFIGIEWGYRMRSLSLKIDSIEPSVLPPESFGLDFQIFQDNLSGYTTKCD